MSQKLFLPVLAATTLTFALWPTQVCIGKESDQAVQPTDKVLGKWILQPAQKGQESFPRGYKRRS